MPGQVGRPLQDGFSTVVGFSADTTIALYTKTAKPPGWDGGASVDTTTMENKNLTTMAPRKLKSMTPGRITVAYDEGMLTRIEALVNVPCTVTWTFPTGRPYSHYGYLRTWEPDPLVEGTQPTATCEIVSTLTNPSTLAETEPVLGTTTTTTTTTS